MPMEEYIVSARKYRPMSFDTVVGQSALTTTLKNAIAQGKLAHAYLFCGPRGVGKTTCARIFAKTINCLAPTANGEACNECESCRAFNEGRSLSIHELDAASNNSVEDIRQLIEQVHIPPQVGRYKVFIIDEVHMLSAAAFNAFLKTLEEPPAHVIFILATTEKHKILPTILSRCQIYDFGRMTVSDTVEHLKHVAEREGYTVEEEALNVIAQKADGGMRDALSIFDQVVSFTGGQITYDKVIANLNVLDYDYYFRLTDHLLQAQLPECLLLFNDVLEHGFEGGHFINGLASHLRNLLVGRDAVTLKLLEVSDSVRARYQEQALRCEPKWLYRAIKLCNECDINYRASKNKRLLVEITLIQAAQLTLSDEDGVAGRPATILKPLFKGIEAAEQPSTPAPLPQPATPISAVAEPQAAYSPAPSHSPLPQAQSASPRIPTLKMGTFGPSIRRPSGRTTLPGGITAPAPRPSADVPATTQESQVPAAPVAQALTEQNLSFYWHEFINLMPKEETALAQRMKIMQPRQMDDVTFNVLVDNEQVATYMRRLTPRIEAHLQAALHNPEVAMHVQVAEVQQAVKAYSKPEQLRMMSEKNPTLRKLVEEFGLEIN